MVVNLKVSHFLSLVHVQAIMKLRSQANSLVFSYLWWILEPLLYVMLFYFVFKFVLYRGSDNFFLFLMAGKIPFLWFSKGVNSSANSLTENKGLIGQRIIPKMIFPLVNCLEAFYKQPLSFAVLIGFLILNGLGYQHDWWQLIIIMLLQFLLIFGVGAFFAVFVTLIPDVKMVIQLFMLGLMFTSGIFWDVNLIQDPNVRHYLMMLNPVAALIEAYRDIFINHTTLEYKYLVSVFCWSVFSIGSAHLLIKNLNNTLTRKLVS